jgi:hypothetical protein
VNNPDPVQATLAAVLTPVFLQILADGITRLGTRRRPWRVRIGDVQSTLDRDAMPSTFPTGFAVAFTALGVNLSLIFGGVPLGPAGGVGPVSDTAILGFGGVGAAALNVWLTSVWVERQWSPGRTLWTSEGGQPLAVSPLEFRDSAVCGAVSIAEIFIASIALALPVWALTA